MHRRAKSPPACALAVDEADAGHRLAGRLDRALNPPLHPSVARWRIGPRGGAGSQHESPTGVLRGSKQHLGRLHLGVLDET